jgi:hypothetical protein
VNKKMGRKNRPKMNGGGEIIAPEMSGQHLPKKLFERHFFDKV